MYLEIANNVTVVDRGCGTLEAQNRPGGASRTESRNVPKDPDLLRSLVPERLDRIGSGTVPRGIETRDHADDDAHDDGDDGPLQREREREVEHPRRPEAGEDADHDSHDGADHAEDDRLDQEELEDVTVLESDGFHDADLAGSFGHADQHDVGDADCADDERDDGDTGDEPRERVQDALDLFDELLVRLYGRLVRRREEFARVGVGLEVG